MSVSMLDLAMTASLAGSVKELKRSTARCENIELASPSSFYYCLDQTYWGRLRRVSTVEENTDSVITEATIEAIREQIAAQPEDWQPAKRQWHYAATRDTIRHWAWGIGDDNPLWVNHEYGKSSSWGTNLAPPSFLYSATSGMAHENATGARNEGKGGPLAGIHAVWVQDAWRWYAPIVCGSDTLATEKKQVEVIPHESRFGRLVAEIITETRVMNGDGQLLGTQRTSFMHHGRRAAAEAGKYKGIVRHVWSDEELESLVGDIDREIVRGAEPLVWSDIQIGEEIPHVVKGPLSVSEMVTFLQGWGGTYRAASEIAHKYFRKHPRANVPDRVSRFPDFPGRAHVDSAWARECGFPDAYDIGAQRISWLMHGVTNWMGDESMLKSFSARLQRLNIIGDATWVRARVTGKEVDDDGDRVVHLSVAAINQRGEETAVAQATVRPSK